MATHSSILAWKSPWTEEPGELKSMGLYDGACVHEGGGRWVGSNKVVELKKKRVFPGGSDSKESARNAGDQGLIPGLGRPLGEQNGNPLQYSCLEIPWTEGPGGLQVHSVSELDTTEWLTQTKSLQINAGESAKKRESSDTAGGRVNWCSHYGKQCVSSSEN